MVHFCMFAFLFKEGQLLKKRVCSSWRKYFIKNRPNLKWTLYPEKRSSLFFFFFFLLKFRVFNAPLGRTGLLHSATTGGVKQSLKKVFHFAKKVVEHETVASRVAMLYRIGLPSNKATP